MRKFFLGCFLIIVSLNCRKNISGDSFMSAVHDATALRMDPAAFNQLDWNKTIVSREGALDFMRIAVAGKDIVTDFLLIHLSGNRLLEGRIISIHPFQNSGLASGSITIHGLDGSVILDNAPIVDGYIEWHQSSIHLREMVVPGATGKVLPEVIIVSTYNKSAPLSQYYYSLAGLIGGGTNTSAYYSSASGGGGTTSPGTSGTPPPTGKSDSKIDNPKGGGSSGDVILVDFETSQENPAISLDQYIKCFSAVPDNGATCSITIFTDIPVDGRPDEFFDWKNGSPGHSFLQLQKTNGMNSVIQMIGFYPKSGWKTFATPAPVSSKFVDNGGHEFNASLKMNLSTVQLQNILIEVARHQLYQYDIDDYNCTDFALEIFNYQRTNKLVIPKYDLPGGQAPTGSNTPQGLYIQLKGMKSGGGVDAANITVPAVKGFVPYSKGPCN